MAAPVLTSATFPLVLSQVEDSGVLSGTAVTWGTENANGVVYEPGAFTSWLGSGNLPALLWQHREDEPIGVVSTVAETSTGLEFSAALNLDTARGREAHSLLKQGALTGVSMGVMPTSTEPRSGVLHVKSGDLWELSLVTFPADPAARVAHVSAVTPLSARTRLIRARHAARNLGGI